MEPKILFVSKKRINSYGQNVGLLNSSNIIAESLTQLGYNAKAVIVVDNNGIDKELTEYKPTHCFIEALWVVPEKFKELKPLHPKVNFFVRIHSEVPFLAHEGIAMEWLYQYKEDGIVQLAYNNDRMARDMAKINLEGLYLPNLYLMPDSEKDTSWEERKTINVGCFGAIRPFKNHLTQAIAAINYSNLKKIKLKFHINGGRTEQKGEQFLKNLVNLFKYQDKHELIKHPWMPYDEFFNLVRKMDLGMQVSFSETFNIVTADFARCNIPSVVSTEIDWMPNYVQANPNDVNDIVEKINDAIWWNRFFPYFWSSKEALENYNINASFVWKRFLNEFTLKLLTSSH